MSVSSALRSVAERVSDGEWPGAQWTVGRTLRTGTLALLFVLYPVHVSLSLAVTNVNVSYGDPVIAVVLLALVLGLAGAVRLPRYVPFVALFLVVAAASVAVNLALGSHVSLTAWAVDVLKFLGGVAWMVGVFALARDRPATLLPVGALTSVVVGATLAAWTIYASVTGDVVRPTGPFENPNIYANYLLLNVSFVPYLRRTWIVERWPGSQVALLPALLALLVGIVVTGSRGTMIGLAAGVFVIPLFSPPLDAARVYAGAALAAVGVLAAFVFVPEYLPRTVRHTATRVLEVKNLQVRLEQWRVGLRAFRSNPFLGIGYGQYSDYLYRLTGRTNKPHNVFVYYAAEVGIVGLLAFLSILGAAVRDSLELRRGVPGVVFVGAFVVATVAEGAVTDVDNFRALWIAIGFVAAYHARRRCSDGTPRELLERIRECTPPIVHRSWNR